MFHEIFGSNMSVRVLAHNLKWILFSAYILYLPPNQMEMERFHGVYIHLPSPNITKVYVTLVDNCDIRIEVILNQLSL